MSTVPQHRARKRFGRTFYATSALFRGSFVPLARVRRIAWSKLAQARER